MNGFHGTLNVKSNASALNLQLAELFGENVVEAIAPKSFNVNISNAVEETAFIATDTDEVILDGTLNHLVEKIVNKGKFVSGDPTASASLAIKSNGSLTLGKLSWIDSFGIQTK